MFIHKFTGTGKKDGGNSWYDIGYTQVPIINGLEMGFNFRTGENEFGDGQVWNRFIQPEATHLDKHRLPPHEHPLYLNDMGRTYHVFSDGAWLAQWALDVDGGQHTFAVELYGDWVDIVNGVKQPKPDPDHAWFRFGGGEWQRLNLMGENHLSQTSGTVSFEILTRYAKGSGKGANGCFIKSMSLLPATEKPVMVIYQSPVEPRRFYDWAKAFLDAVVWTSDLILVGDIGSQYRIFIPATYTIGIDTLEKLGLDYQTI